MLTRREKKIKYIISCYTYLFLIKYLIAINGITEECSFHDINVTNSKNIPQKEIQGDRRGLRYSLET